MIPPVEDKPPLPKITPNAPAMCWCGAFQLVLHTDLVSPDNDQFHVYLRCSRCAAEYDMQAIHGLLARVVHNSGPTNKPPMPRAS